MVDAIVQEIGTIASLLFPFKLNMKPSSPSKIWPIIPIPSHFFLSCFLSSFKQCQAVFCLPTFGYVAPSTWDVSASISMKWVTSHSLNDCLNVTCQQDLCLPHPQHVHFYIYLISKQIWNLQSIKQFDIKEEINGTKEKSEIRLKCTREVSIL